MNQICDTGIGIVKKEREVHIAFVFLCTSLSEVLLVRLFLAAKIRLNLNHRCNR